MLKKIVTLLLVCISFASCERSNPDFNITDDIVNVGTSNWQATSYTRHTYSHINENPVYNNHEVLPTAGVVMNLQPDGFAAFTFSPTAAGETTWEAIKNDEIVIYSSKITPPFEEITYKVTNLTRYNLEMTNKITTTESDITTVVTTKLVFERS